MHFIICSDESIFFYEQILRIILRKFIPMNNPNPLQTTHELASGSLTINATECKNNDLINITITLSFLRHSDGKLFECSLDDDEIQNLHQIFFDTTLILDILEHPPSSLNCVHINTDSNSDPDPPLYTEGDDRKTYIENVQNVESECINVVWIFTQAVIKTHGLSKKSKDYPITIRIREKVYPPCSNQQIIDSNQQIIELNRLLTCYKQRIDDLEMLWTTYCDLENGKIPIQNQFHRLTLEDMEWLSFSNYGKMTGLNKYYEQFKSSEDMAKQLYPKIQDVNELSVLKKQYGNKLPCYILYKNNSQRHIQNWLLENKLQFDEIKSAEFLLNKWIETSKKDLVDVQIHSGNNRMHKYIDCNEYSYDPNPLNFSHIVSGTLFGYFRAANPRKKKAYVIAKSTDPVPVKYEKAYYLKDAYKPIRDYVLTFPAISNINEETEKHIAYISQWVIYKICI